MPETTLAFLMIAIGILFFWCLVYWLIAELGGWKSLAKIYATEQENRGDIYSWVSSKFSFVSNYRNCLTVSISEAGIRVQPMLLFRFCHQPLFFPWSAILALYATRNFFQPGAVLEVKSGEKVHPITIYGSSLVTSITRHAPSRLKDPPG